MIQRILDILANFDWGIVVGVIALYIAARSLRIQREHNRLSVKPIAIISVGDYLDELAVYLQNKGTGPLIINDLSFLSDNGRKEKSLVRFFDTDFDDVVWSTFVDEIDGWAILPGDTKTLIKLEKNPSIKDFSRTRNRVREILATIQVKLDYQDIYENDMPSKTRKLDFFAR